uniref:Ig-like domain-containing protein n=1 Tax=Chrysemys picta bellii TaxID=8478 RepID=A0A8C3FF84_CHRPI
MRAQYQPPPEIESPLPGPGGLRGASQPGQGSAGQGARAVHTPQAGGPGQLLCRGLFVAPAQRQALPLRDSLPCPLFPMSRTGWFGGAGNGARGLSPLGGAGSHPAPGQGLAGSGAEPPEVTVFPEDPVELGEPNILICFAVKFSPPVLSVTWLKNGQEVTEGVSETDFYPHQDNSFRKFSYLPFLPSQGDFYDSRVRWHGPATHVQCSVDIPKEGECDPGLYEQGSIEQAQGDAVTSVHGPGETITGCRVPFRALPCRKEAEMLLGSERSHKDESRAGETCL